MEVLPASFRHTAECLRAGDKLPNGELEWEWRVTFERINKAGGPWEPHRMECHHAEARMRGLGILRSTTRLEGWAERKGVAIRTLEEGLSPGVWKLVIVKFPE